MGFARAVEACLGLPQPHLARQNPAKQQIENLRHAAGGITGI
jgi:hypothetical protein